MTQPECISFLVWKRSEFFRAPPRRDLAISHTKEFVGDGQKLVEPMLRHQNRHAALLELDKDAHERVCALRVQVGGRLIEREKRRATRNSGCDCDALFLTAGQFGKLLSK